MSQRALELDPDSAASHSALAFVYVDRKEYDAAQGEIDQVMRLDSGSILAVAPLAQLKLAQGKLEEAQSAFRQAVSLAPQDPSGHMGLASVAALRKQSGETLEHAWRAFQLHRSTQTITVLVVALASRFAIVLGVMLLGLILLAFSAPWPFDLVATLLATALILLGAWLCVQARLKFATLILVGVAVILWLDYFRA